MNIETERILSTISFGLRQFRFPCTVSQKQSFLAWSQIEQTKLNQLYLIFDLVLRLVCQYNSGLIWTVKQVSVLYQVWKSM